MKNKKNENSSVVLTLLSALFLVSMPTLSQADYCSEIKERYWKCTRSSMSGGKCDSSDNVSIPPECLTAGTKTQKKGNSSGYAPPSSSSFFKSRKKITPYQPPNLVPKKPIKVINIKQLNSKKYIETEEDVNNFTTKIKDELLNALKEGKRVRLQFY